MLPPLTITTNCAELLPLSTSTNCLIFFNFMMGKVKTRQQILGYSPAVVRVLQFVILWNNESGIGLIPFASSWKCMSEPDCKSFFFISLETFTLNIYFCFLPVMLPGSLQCANIHIYFCWLLVISPCSVLQGEVTDNCSYDMIWLLSSDPSLLRQIAYSLVFLPRCLPETWNPYY